MLKYKLKVQCSFNASVTAFKADEEYFDYDFDIPNRYMEKCRKMIVNEIFEYSLDNYIDPHRNYTVDSTYHNGSITVTIDYEGLYNKKQIKKIVEDIEDAIDLGADTWAEGDLVMVNNQKCKDYGLGDLDDNVYLDVFFQRIGEVEVFKTHSQPDWVKGRCIVHLIDIDTNDEAFTPEHVKKSNLYDNLIKKMRRGDIVENVNTKDYRSKNILFFDGKNIIDRGKTIDKHGNIPEEFDMLSEFNPGYWDLNAENTRHGENKPYNINSTLIKNKIKKSTFCWNSNSAYGYVDITNYKYHKALFCDIKYISLELKSKSVALIYANDDAINDPTKIIVKNVELYDSIELYKEFKRHTTEDIIQFQRVVTKLNKDYNYVLIAK